MARCPRAFPPVLCNLCDKALERTPVDVPGQSAPAPTGNPVSSSLPWANDDAHEHDDGFEHEPEESDRPSDSVSSTRPNEAPSLSDGFEDSSTTSASHGPSPTPPTVTPSSAALSQVDQLYLANVTNFFDGDDELPPKTPAATTFARDATTASGPISRNPAAPSPQAAWHSTASGSGGRKRKAVDASLDVVTSTSSAAAQSTSLYGHAATIKASNDKTNSFVTDVTTWLDQPLWCGFCAAYGKKQVKAHKNPQKECLPLCQLPSNVCFQCLEQGRQVHSAKNCPRHLKFQSLPTKYDLCFMCWLPKRCMIKSKTSGEGDDKHAHKYGNCNNRSIRDYIWTTCWRAFRSKDAKIWAWLDKESSHTDLRQQDLFAPWLVQVRPEYPDVMNALRLAHFFHSNNCT